MPTTIKVMFWVYQADGSITPHTTRESANVAARATFPHPKRGRKTVRIVEETVTTTTVTRYCSNIEYGE